MIQIFKVVNAKDVFEEFYMRGLSRRLLLKKSASQEQEKLMITKLRNELSYEFGNKSDSMLKDLGENEKLLKEYRTMRGGEEALREKSHGIEANYHVLSQGSWPIRAEVKNAVLPPIISDVQEDFKKYYMSRHQGKCLTFCP